MAGGSICGCEKKDREMNRIKTSCKKCQKKGTKNMLLLVAWLLSCFFGLAIVRLSFISMQTCEFENHGDIRRMVCDANVTTWTYQFAFLPFVVFVVWHCITMMLFIEFAMDNDKKCDQSCGRTYCDYCNKKKYHRFFIKMFDLFRLNSISNWIKK